MTVALPSVPRDRAALAAIARVQKIALAVGIAGLAVLGAGMAFAPARALSNLLVGAYLVLGLAAGGLVLLSLLAVANAGWAVVLKRIFEAFGAFVPIAAVLLLSTTPGLRVLYACARPDAAADELLAAKAAFLNAPFFLIRMVLILAIWSLFSALLRRASLRQDTTGDVAETRRTVRLAAGFLVCFAVTGCLAAFDWIMTLEARWFSTIFGFYNLAGILVSTVSAVALAAVALRRAGALPELSESHLHDLGKLMLAFATFWAYQWISQFLLIWYANIPEETAYFELRWQGGWMPVFFANIVLGWAVPFVALLPRAVKRDPRTLATAACLLLFARWLDIWQMVMPANFPTRPWPGLLELAGLAGPAGLFVFHVARSFQRVPLLARRDPYFAESTHHHI
jgi:Ni/Fe-hydrogenase subunit HybB-like protein